MQPEQRFSSDGSRAPLEKQNSLLDAFDPLAKPSGGSRESFGSRNSYETRPRSDEEIFATKFSELTGLDPTTSLVHVRAAMSRGATLDQAVDQFYANDKKHVLPERGASSRRMMNDETSAADAALAHAMAKNDASARGSDQSAEELVRRLEDMGFGRPESLRAARECPTLRAATEHILREEGGKVSHSRRTNMATMLNSEQHQRHQQPSPRVSLEGRQGGARSPKRAPQNSRMSAASMFPGEESARTVTFAGRLAKLSRASGIFGARWQMRQFSLRNCELSYDQRFFENVWSCYAMREPPSRSQGRDFCFGVYSAGSETTTRSQLVLLAAEDAEECSTWLSRIYAASGREGFIMRTSTDNQATTLRCIIAMPTAGELEARAVNSRLVVQTASGFIEKLGLRLEDEITEIDGQVIPLLSAAQFRLRVDSARRPFELTVRRPHSNNNKPQINNKLSVDLLSLDDFEEMPINGPLTPPPPPMDNRGQQHLFPEDDDEPTHRRSLSPMPPARPPRLSLDNNSEEPLGMIRAALDAERRGDNAAVQADHATAGREYAEVLAALIRVQPIFVSDARVRDLVAASLPGVSLASLYDSVVAKKDASANAPTVGPPTKMTYRAIVDFRPAAPWQLALAADEPLELVEHFDDGWSDVYNAGLRRGLVPTTHVSKQQRR